MIKLRTSLLAAILTLLALPAFAADCSLPPTMDGIFSESEWAGAERYPFGLRTPEGDVVEADLWVTNDAENLYVAIRHRYTALTSNSASVVIDANHSLHGDAGDDAIGSNWNQWGQIAAHDLFYGLPNCPGCNAFDAQHGGTNDVAAGATTQDGWHTTEMAHPFTGLDGLDLRASLGDYLSLQLFNRVFNANGEMADTEHPAQCPRFVVYRLRDCNRE